jgi:hypothetical protein
VPIHNLLADRQPDASAGIFLAAVKPLKDDKDALGVLRSNTNAVVPYGEGPPIAVSAGRDVDAGRFVAPELDGVSDQVGCSIARKLADNDFQILQGGADD